MLTIELYNQLRGTHFAATEHNLALINKLNSLGVTETEVRDYRMPAGSKQHEMRQMASDFAKTHKGPGTPAATPAEPAEPVVPIKEVKKMPTTNPNADAVLAAMSSLLTAPGLDSEELKKMIDKSVDEKIKDVRPVKIEVTSPKGVRTIEGVTHEEFEDVLDYINRGKGVYMYGPAGTGKSHMAKQIADALGLKYWYSGQLLQTYELTGFTDANGRYQPTPWYHACTEGGLMFFDELDRSTPEAVTKINGALANRYFDFPAPIGTVKLHPDFRCIAAGNTLGKGATGIYTAANALDGSTLNRFLKVPMDYDKRIEDAIDKEAAAFIRALRKAAQRAGLDIILSYRQISALAELSESRGVAKVIKHAITAELSEDDINILKNNQTIKDLASKGNKYAKALA